MDRVTRFAEIDEAACAPSGVRSIKKEILCHHSRAIKLSISDLYLTPESQVRRALRLYHHCLSYTTVNITSNNYTITI